MFDLSNRTVSMYETGTKQTITSRSNVITVYTVNGNNKVTDDMVLTMIIQNDNRADHCEAIPMNGMRHDEKKTLTLACPSDMEKKCSPTIYS